MENQASSKSIMLTYGFYLGVLSLLPSIAKYAMGTHLERDTLSGILSFVISVILIALGLRHFKKTNNGLMSWGEGVKIGMGMTAISLVIVVIYLALFTNVIEPNFKDQVVEQTRQGFIESNMDSDMIETQIGYVNDYFYITFYGFTVIVSLFFGFIISAITAAIMKKAEDQF